MKLGFLNYLNFKDGEVGIIVEKSIKSNRLMDNIFRASHQYDGVATGYYENEIYYHHLISDNKKIKEFTKEWNYKLIYFKNAIIHPSQLNEFQLKLYSSKKMGEKLKFENDVLNNKNLISYKKYSKNLSEILNKQNENKDISNVKILDFVEALCPCKFTYKGKHKMRGYVVWKNCD